MTGSSLPMDFTDRVALVTGGGSGIGQAVARLLADLGAGLVVADLDLAAAQATAAELAGEALALQVDVSDAPACEAMVAAVLERFGRLDILVHSAGTGVERTFLETSPEEWRRLIDINLSGTFYACQAAARPMVEAGYGRIVNLASVAGMRGGENRAAYGATKGGVINLTQVMAVELGVLGVNVNALAPGPIETALVKRMHTDETRRTYRSGVPLDRYGEPEEVAHAAAFLASEQASYINGHVLAVDGGFLAAGVMKPKSDAAS